MKPQKIAVGTPVHIVWNDIVSNSAWHYNDSAKKLQLATIDGIGYVVRNTPEALTIAGHFDKTDNSSAALTAVPWGTIKKVTQIATG